jgi:transcription-repair coupling factor (superfamily II helicase)
MSIPTLLDLANRSNNLSLLSEKIAEGKNHIAISGLVGSGKSFLLAFLKEKLQVPILVLTYHPDEATKLFEDLQSFLGEDEVLFFPSREILPYELEVPYSEVLGARLSCLYELLLQRKKVVVTHIRAVLEKTIPPDELKSKIIQLKVGQELEMDDLVQRILGSGFKRTPQVEEVGTYSQRGGILDLFPYTSENPLRIEFFGNRIESIREFSVFNQRTIIKKDEATILPKREFYLGDEELERYLRGLEDKKAQNLRDRINLYQDIPGLEWMAPLFKLPQGELFDYLPEDTLCFLDEPELIKREIEQIWEEAKERYQEVDARGELVPKPDAFLKGATSLENRIKKFQHLDNYYLKRENLDFDLGMTESESLLSDFTRLKKSLEKEENGKRRIYITCENSGQRERLEELLEKDAEKVTFLLLNLSSGFLFPELELTVLPEHQLFRRYFRRRRKRKFKEGMPLSTYTSLSSGDFVVHIDFGIGRYAGLETLSIDEKKRDCLLLIYKDGDKLYVPVEEFNRIQKYIGKDGEPNLSKLGSPSWEKTKEKTKEALKEMAEGLIQLYAERKAKPGYAFSSDTPWQKELESSFIYEETPDQIEAIETIKKDMEKPVPMDRLICGDVGYGKTEVALRAAFKCVMDGKQVAVLVPTTILAQQHHATFTERLKDYPVQIEVLSRFKSPKEQKEVIDSVKRGKIDILIGTHRLLQKDIQFKDLGLLIVDEEQRFGVAHKEKLKKFKKSVDVLTLTATPIPRTLQLSLLGAKDMSIINTPPKDRLPIQTSISRFDKELIAEAILREADRGGQVYFVHNRVESINSIYNLLRKLLPELRLAVAHGQMEEKVLEKIMLQFLEGKYDCLLCTNIIESGLDLPNVNTILINRADRFGLAELYQLKGRVGRSNRKAYAYLLVPDFGDLTPQARKRLSAIQQYTQLGSGFYLALRDLEIRGAGNILGPQQHGFIEEIGFDLYCQLLEEAVREIKGEEIKKIKEAKLEMDLDLFLPQEYIADSQQRMEIYKKLSEIKKKEEVDDLKVELQDRFGPLPREAQELLEISEIKLLCQAKGISKLTLRRDRLKIEFDQSKKVGKEEIRKYREGLTYPMEFFAEENLKMELSLNSTENRLGQTKKVLQKL